MNLTLIGYRGTGKSSLANLLHQRMDYSVYHMDEMLEERFGEKIAAFVEKKGWEIFRDQEQALAEELAEMDNIIIDTGGGVIVRDANIQNLRRTSFVVWLQTSPDKIARRIYGDSNRPSLTGSKSSADEIVEVLRQREPLYKKIAHITVDTGQHSIDECLEIILKAWNQKHETLETA